MVTEEEKKAFGERLRTVADKPQEIARMIEVQRTSIYNYLSGNVLPSFDIIQRLMKKRPDIDYYWLITGEYVQPEGKGKINSAEDKKIHELTTLVKLQQDLLDHKDHRIEILNGIIKEMEFQLGEKDKK